MVIGLFPFYGHSKRLTSNALLVFLRTWGPTSTLRDFEAYSFTSFSAHGGRPIPCSYTYSRSTCWNSHGSDDLYRFDDPFQIVSETICNCSNGLCFFGRARFLARITGFRVFVPRVAGGGWLPGVEAITTPTHSTGRSWGGSW